MITKLPGGTAQLFAANCAACHGIAAQGSRDTYFPAFSITRGWPLAEAAI
jgi:mono/diheme cytochrome c family protein